MKAFKRERGTTKFKEKRKFKEMKEGTPIAVTSSYKNAKKKRGVT